MGDIETALLSDLAKIGIYKPGTTDECSAVRIAGLLDRESLEPKDAANLSRELRTLWDRITGRPAPKEDFVDEIGNSLAKKLGNNASGNQ